MDLRAPAARLAWPVGIALALGLFIVVQVAFVIVAVRNTDTVVESYRTEPR